MKLLQLLDKYLFLVSLFYSMFSFILGFMTNKILIRIKWHNIRKCLSLNKSDCKIVLPNYNKKIHNKTDVLKVCPIDDIKAASNVIDLIHATGLYSDQQTIIFEPNYSDASQNFNIFCIGGSLANQFSYDIFQEFFPNFKIVASKEKVETNPNQRPPSHFVLNEYKKGFCWGESTDEHFLVNRDERYAIIVKLTENDFEIKNHGTVHILFGNGVEGTLAISKYLLHNFKDLSKRTKGKKHYFIAFKLKRQSGLIDAKSFIDLTDIMFPTKNKL